MMPAQSAEVFRQQIQSLFEDTSLEVNEWLFLAEKAQAHTYHTSGEEAIAWYRNAMLIYDFLEKREQQPFLSRIYVRLNIIKIYGPNHAQSIPFQDEIKAWVMKDLPEDAEQLETESRQWVQLPIERIRELRLLKMKLEVAQQLEEKGIALPDTLLALIPLKALLP